MPKEKIDAMVKETQQLVAELSHKVSKLRSDYKWLLYFSVPKMLRLYQFINPSELIGKTKKINSILHEVSFMAVNQTSEREKLKNSIQVL